MKHKIYIAIFVFFFVLLNSKPSYGAVQSFQSDTHSVIDKNQPDKTLSCFGGSTPVNKNIYYAMRFPLNDFSVPANRITNATVKISGNNVRGNFVLQKILSSWSPDSLTWNFQATSTPLLYQQELNPLTYIRYRFPLTETVKSWVDKPADNFGLFLRPGLAGNGAVADDSDNFVCTYGSSSPLILQLSLDIEYCSEDEWTCGDYGACAKNGLKIRACNKTFDCPGLDTTAPATEAPCAQPAPADTPVYKQEFPIAYDNIIENLNPQSVNRCVTYGDIGSSSAYSGNTYRYLGKINLDAPKFPADRIVRATFKIDRVSNTWDDDLNYILQKVTSNWSPLSVTWGSQPKVEATQYNIIPNVSKVEFDVTDAYKEWRSNEQSNYGVLVRKTVENNSFNSHKGSFGCSNYTNDPPRVVVEYCTADMWECSEFSSCSADGKQNRVCIKSFDCPGIETASPSISQSCTPPTAPKPINPTTPQTPAPACATDVWNCTEWNDCGANGTQTRSCIKSFDCSVAETPAPSTSQSCSTSTPSPTPAPAPSQTPNAPSTPTAPPEDIPDNIFRATVKLICETATVRSQGSGTIIDEKGTILTNRHVLEAEKGKIAPICYIGFTADPDEEPNFSEIATPKKISTKEDAALLSISNPTLSSYPTINFSQLAQAKKLKLGNKIQVLGYPGVGGSKLTYSSGDFSGFGSSQNNLSNYLKTTAVIEQGNSGGGAYTKSNLFIGIPTLVVSGKIGSIGYLLAASKIQDWMQGQETTTQKYLPNTGIAVSLQELREQIQNNADFRPPEVSSASVKVATAKKNKLQFSITGVSDVDSSLSGYYMYFGADARANPVARGIFTIKPYYTVKIPSKTGTYYFIFVAKDSNKNLSEPYIFEYHYAPAAKVINKPKAKSAPSTPKSSAKTLPQKKVGK